MLPATTNRVRKHTSKDVNAWIRSRTENNITRYRSAGNKLIDRRLVELDHEWDMERTLEANASALALFGLVLGMTTNKKWLALPTIVAGFLFQHALQGWCPPVPVFRRLGFRTADEIDNEKFALKIMRGDFTQVNPSSGAVEVLRAVGR